MNKKTNKVFHICIIALMAALYFVLDHFLTIRPAKNFTISAASLPIIILSTLYGPLDGCLAALIGEFLNQLLTYGLALTTPLWVLPPMVRAFVVAMGCRFLKKKHPERMPWEHQPSYCVALMIAAVCATLANTAVIWADSVLMHYYSFTYVFGSFFIRLGTGLLTALLMTSVVIPVLYAVKKSRGETENAIFQKNDSGEA